MSADENKEEKTAVKKCVICGRIINGYGNNAEPIKKGRCCNRCNEMYVIPKRLELILNNCPIK